MKTNNVVATGRENLLNAPETRKKINDIKEQIERDYASRLSEAGWMKLFFLKIEMKRKLKEELQQIAPSDGLYCF